MVLWLSTLRRWCRSLCLRCSAGLMAVDSVTRTISRMVGCSRKGLTFRSTMLIKSLMMANVTRMQDRWVVPCCRLPTRLRLKMTKTTVSVVESTTLVMTRLIVIRAPLLSPVVMPLPTSVATIRYTKMVIDGSAFMLDRAYRIVQIPTTRGTPPVLAASGISGLSRP